MSVYVHEQYMTADAPAEAAAMAERLSLPVDRLRMADTPRWHWLVEPVEREWAITHGALEVGLYVFKMLVIARRVNAGERPAGVIVCGPPPRKPPKWNPQLRRHRWVKDPIVHQRHCEWCGIVTENRPVPKSGAWYRAWRWPGSTAPDGWDGSTRDPGTDGKVPACPGPGGAPAPKPPPPPKPEQGTLC